MGKGDKKTRRGKLFSGSYGVTRPRKKKKNFIPPAKPVKNQPEKEKIEKTIDVIPSDKGQESKKIAKPQAVTKKPEVAKKQDKKETKAALPKEETKVEPGNKPVQKEKDVKKEIEPPKVADKKTVKSEKPSKSETRKAAKPAPIETKEKPSAKTKQVKKVKTEKKTTKSGDKEKKTE